MKTFFSIAVLTSIFLVSCQLFDFSVNKDTDDQELIKPEPLQFEQLAYSNSPGYYATDYWMDGEKGFASISDGKIIKTTDGFKTRSEITLNKPEGFPTSSSIIPLSIFFLDETNGWIGCKSFSNFNSIIYRTTDGGDNWTPHIITSSEQAVFDVKDVYFTTEDRGYLTTDNATFKDIIYTTTDGGLNWTEHPLPNIGAVYKRIHFFDENNGMLLGNTTYKGVALITSDGGVTWTQLKPDGNNFGSVGIMGIHVTDSNNYYLFGSTGFVIKRSDGGVTWQEINITNCNQEVGDIYFTDSNTGYACASNAGYFYITQDGGITWHRQIVYESLNQSFINIYIHNKNLYLLGTSSQLSAKVGYMIYKAILP